MVLKHWIIQDCGFVVKVWRWHGPVGDQTAAGAVTIGNQTVECNYTASAEAFRDFLQYFYCVVFHWHHTCLHLHDGFHKRPSRRYRALSDYRRCSSFRLMAVSVLPGKALYAYRTLSGISWTAVPWFSCCHLCIYIKLVRLLGEYRGKNSRCRFQRHI